MRKLILALAALGTIACGPFHRGPSGTATVVFNNQTTDQADVYATTAGTDPIRIGTVMGGQTTSLTVPATVIGASGQLSIVAHILAGPNVSTGPFSLGAGQTAELRLPIERRNIVITTIH